MLLILLALVVSADCASRKLYAAGSGVNMLSQPETVAEVIALSGKSKPHVLYLGTATYDDPEPMHEQTKGFAGQGCVVDALRVAWTAPSEAELTAAFTPADIVLISGGNTLFAVDRWVKLGIDKLMKQAHARGAVLSGGSAGFISLCNGGHSDSMEPDSFKNPPGPLLNASVAVHKEVSANWAYVRVPGTGVIDSLCCPHYDMTGSNGVHRSVDFTSMMRHHVGEYAVALDK